MFRKTYLIGKHLSFGRLTHLSWTDRTTVRPMSIHIKPFQIRTRGDFLRDGVQQPNRHQRDRYDAKIHPAIWQPWASTYGATVSKLGIGFRITAWPWYRSSWNSECIWNQRTMYCLQKHTHCLRFRWCTAHKHTQQHQSSENHIQAISTDTRDKPLTSKCPLTLLLELLEDSGYDRASRGCKSNTNAQY